MAAICPEDAVGRGKSASRPLRAGYGMSGWNNAPCPAQDPSALPGAGSGVGWCVPTAGRQPEPPVAWRGSGHPAPNREGCRCHSIFGNAFPTVMNAFTLGGKKNKSSLLLVLYTRENPTYRSGNRLPLEGKTLFPIGKNRASTAGARSGMRERRARGAWAGSPGACCPFGGRQHNPPSSFLQLLFLF